MERKIPANKFPDIFLEWLAKITKGTDWWNIQIEDGYVVFVKTKKLIAPDPAGIKHKYAAIYADKSGTYLELKYRPRILDSAKGCMIVC